MTSSHGEHRLDDGRAGEGVEPEVIVRDRRRIDPESGQVRSAAAAASSAATATAAEAPAAEGGPGATESEAVAALREQVNERTADLQRLKAEFDNYRRRVERDRQTAADGATAKLLTGLLGVLDDIGRARDHGDLEGPFKAIAESLVSALEATGLERFGAPGEEFDPRLHDALMTSYRSDVTTTVVAEVFRAGYRRGQEVLRPAQVVVAEPSGESEATPAEPAEQATSAGQSDQPAPSVGTDRSAEADSGIADRVADIGGRSGPVPDDTGSIPGPDRGGPTVSAD